MVNEQYNEEDDINEFIHHCARRVKKKKEILLIAMIITFTLVIFCISIILGNIVGGNSMGFSNLQITLFIFLGVYTIGSLTDSDSKELFKFANGLMAIDSIQPYDKNGFSIVLKNGKISQIWLLNEYNSEYLIFPNPELVPDFKVINGVDKPLTTIKIDKVTELTNSMNSKIPEVISEFKAENKHIQIIASNVIASTIKLSTKLGKLIRLEIIRTLFWFMFTLLVLSK